MTKTYEPGDRAICSVMPSIMRMDFHIRILPPGGMDARGHTLCGLPAEMDFHFGFHAWGQKLMGSWCSDCWNRYQAIGDVNET